MSVTEPTESIEAPDSRRVGQYQAKLDDILNPGEMAKLLYRDRKLSRAEFDAKVIEIGYQIALRKLASEACAGDTKALDLFLKRCDQYFAQHRKPEQKDDSAPSPEYTPRVKSE